MCLYHSAEKDAVFQAKIRALNGGETLGAELVRLREQNASLREKNAQLREANKDLVGLLADIKSVAESWGVHAARRIINLCESAADVEERYDAELHNRRATSIEVLRTMSPVGDWYRPYARATYMRMPKADVVDHLGVAFYNWYQTEITLRRAAENSLRLLSAERASAARMEILGGR